MKQSKIQKKLVFKKETIANLKNLELKKVRGGLISQLVGVECLETSGQPGGGNCWASPSSADPQYDCEACED